VQAIDTAQPDMRSDASLVCEVDEAGGVVADHLILNLPIFFDLHLNPVDPVREMVWNLLFIEALCLDAVWKALHVERMVPQMRQKNFRDPLMVFRQIQLIQVDVRKHDLLRPGDLDHARADVQLNPVHAEGCSRTTSSASLSRRRPRKGGWRSFPSSVHSPKPTSTTRLGATQWIPALGSCRPSKGGVLRSSRCS
jgi:hypothetical protein